MFTMINIRDPRYLGIQSFIEKWLLIPHFKLLGVCST